MNKIIFLVLIFIINIVFANNSTKSDDNIIDILNHDVLLGIRVWVAILGFIVTICIGTVVIVSCCCFGSKKPPVPFDDIIDKED